MALEVFADRTYEPDGQLTPRSIDGAVLHDPMQARDHVMRMVEAGGIVTRQGKVIATAFHSICLHDDGCAALETARAVTDTLRNHGHLVEPLDRLFA